MHPTPEQVATNWIDYARYDARDASDRVHERGWLIYELARLHPALAWEAIKCVVARYSQDELFVGSETEAQRVVGNTAAGPLEDLLATHGIDFIDAVEAQCQHDRRMLWALGCVWQNSMTDEIWARVQKAAGNISR